jgi:hypothetical protein
MCVVAPTPEELFTHVERARRRHRRACSARTSSDEQLDAFWRARSDCGQPRTETCVR